MALKAIITTLFLGSSTLAMAAPRGAYNNEARAEHRIQEDRADIRADRRDIRMDRREIRRDHRVERRDEHRRFERRAEHRGGRR